MQADFADARVRRAIYELLDTSFHELSPRIMLAERLGARWPEVSTPFVVFDGDVAVTHVGVLAAPMVIAGRPRIVAGVHAVCTRPGYRGRGFSRHVMEEALEYASRRARSRAAPRTRPTA